MNPQTTSAHDIAEKKQEFLLWLKKKRANERDSGEEQFAQADFAQWQAVMVWIDDGGRVS